MTELSVSVTVQESIRTTHVDSQFGQFPIIVLSPSLLVRLDLIRQSRPPSRSYLESFSRVHGKVSRQVINMDTLQNQYLSHIESIHLRYSYNVSLTRQRS